MQVFQLIHTFWLTKTTNWKQPIRLKKSMANINDLYRRVLSISLRGTYLPLWCLGEDFSLPPLSTRLGTCWAAFLLRLLKRSCRRELCILGWKFMSCTHCQELDQQASWLLIGYTRVNNQSDRSQVNNLTQLLTMTATHKFPLLGCGFRVSVPPRPRRIENGSYLVRLDISFFPSKIYILKIHFPKLWAVL